MCAITADNATNNSTMAENLEKLLKGSTSRFTKNYLTSCMAHVLNLAVQRGLKELGNDDSHSDSEDDDKHVEGLEAISQRPFGKILHRLRKLIIAVNRSPKRIHHYKNLCDELEMPNKNIIVEDVRTRWNSTYDMIEAAWEKREVLKAMASDHLNTNKVNFLIEDDEWELLNMFADELLAFREATEVFSKSKSITLPNVSGLYGLLIQQLDSLIFELSHHLQDLTRAKMSNDQAKTLRHVYTVMKEKLMKYDIQVRRKPMFYIVTVLDPRFKLGHIPHGEHNCVMETLLNMLESMHPIQASTSTPIDDVLASPSHKRSKVMIQFMERQSNRYTTVEEKSVQTEMEEYLREPCVDCLRADSLQWWRKIGSNKYPCISLLAKEFLSICTSSSLSERLFSTGRGIITFRRGRLAPDTISALMTLKSWTHEDVTQAHESDCEVEESGFVK